MHSVQPSLKASQSQDGLVIIARRLWSCAGRIMPFYSRRHHHANSRLHHPEPELRCPSRISPSLFAPRPLSLPTRREPLFTAPLAFHSENKGKMPPHSPGGQVRWSFSPSPRPSPSFHPLSARRLREPSPCVRLLPESSLHPYGPFYPEPSSCPSSLPRLPLP